MPNSAAAEHAHAARPLRARDPGFFEGILCRALAAADAQAVRRQSKEKLCTSFRWAQQTHSSLGGVVIETDFDRAFAHWAAHAQQRLDTIKAKFAFDRFYELHERGEIGASAYFASLRASLGIDISDTQFVDGWNAIYVGEVPGIATLLQRAKEKKPLYAFTNSNPTHQQVWSQGFAEVLSLFHTVFVSSELGKRKPEPEAFHAIAAAIGVMLPRIVFFDDSLENVEGARAIGMQAVHVRSLADIAGSLQEILG